MCEKAFYLCDFESITCPKCGTYNAAKIQYGLLIWSNELKEKLSSGEVTLGGCIVDKEYPIYECNECHERWGRLYDESTLSKEFFDHIESLEQDKN